MADGRRRVDWSSLPLQATLYLHAWYIPLFAALELGCLAFKVVTLPYPARNAWPELGLLLALVAIETTRLFLSSKGNLTQSYVTLLFSLLLTLPSLAALLYFLLWQTFVLIVEVVAIAIFILGLFLQVTLGLLASWLFHHHR